MVLQRIAQFKSYIGFVLLLAAAQFAASAQTNVWTNTVGGNWEDLSWSLGILPNSTQSVMIVNAGSKVVLIGSNTAANYPSSLSIGPLTLSGPDGTTNELLVSDVPLTNYFFIQALNLGTNGFLVGVNSRIDVYQGTIEGHVTQSGGRLVLGGFFTETVIIDAGSVTLSDADCSIASVTMKGPGTIEQTGGNTAISDLIMWMNSGNYVLRSGTVTADTLRPGQFVQYDGTNTVQYLNIDRGAYQFSGGLLAVSHFEVGDDYNYGSGSFTQSGGTATATVLLYGNGFASCALTGGNLYTDHEYLWPDEGPGDFEQSGGLHQVAGTLIISGNFLRDYQPVYSSYELSDGTLTAATLQLQTLGEITQTGGSNLVSGTLELSGSWWYPVTTYSLSSGTLATGNTRTTGGSIIQSGGVHWVTNLLSFNSPFLPAYASPPDAYTFTGGTLVASNIELGGLLTLEGATSPPQIINSGTFVLHGLFNTGGFSQQLGRFILAGNSQIDFGSGASTLQFSDSSSMPWSNGVTLTIANWTGTTNGGGQDQLLFGVDNHGLTALQVQRVRFANPSLFPAGVYPAAILPSGEVVPAPPPTLYANTAADAIVLTWFGAYMLQTATNTLGPYTDLPFATSPFTNGVYTMPQQFFRLRQ